MVNNPGAFIICKISGFVFAKEIIEYFFNEIILLSHIDF